MIYSIVLKQHCFQYYKLTYAYFVVVEDGRTLYIEHQYTEFYMFYVLKLVTINSLYVIPEIHLIKQHTRLNKSKI